MVSTQLGAVVCGTSAAWRAPHIAGEDCAPSGCQPVAASSVVLPARHATHTGITATPSASFGTCKPRSRWIAWFQTAGKLLRKLSLQRRKMQPPEVGAAHDGLLPQARLRFMHAETGSAHGVQADQVGGEDTAGIVRGHALFVQCMSKAQRPESVIWRRSVATGPAGRQLLAQTIWCGSVSLYREGRNCATAPRGSRAAQRLRSSARIGLANR